MKATGNHPLSQDNFTPVEKEVITLYTAIKALDNMVNHVFLNNLGTEVRFHGSPHAELFNSLLTDFITEKKCELSGFQESRLSALLRISKSPHFNQEDTVEELACSCDAFEKWLSCEPVFEKVYFSEIDLEAHLSMSRAFFIKQCGNIVKHNEMSLSRVAEQIRKMVDNNGYAVSMHEAYMMLEDFCEWFQNIFLYHSTTITQYLNDIRHGIKSYLLPENMKVTKVVYNEHFKKEIPRIIIPDAMETEFSRHCYYYLIQDVRRKAYVDRFRTPSYLTMRY